MKEKMNMKKFFALGMAAALSLSLLAGCGSTSSAPSADPGAASPAPTEETGNTWTSVEDLKGKKIAVQEGTTGNDIAKEI